MNKIIPHLTAEEHFGSGCAFWNSHDDWFLQRDQVKVHRYNGSLHLWDITDAMKPGKTCTEFTLRWDHFSNTPAGLYRLFERHDYNLRAVFNELLALPWEHRKFWANGIAIDPPGSAGWQEMTGLAGAANLADFSGDVRWELYRSERPAIRVWSPFASVNPLPHAPKKWTVAHVVRALLAGQFSNLKCDGKYSDDYAYDAAVNFHIGEFGQRPEAAIAFARRILESPSGWWAYDRDGSGRISICCHHFDSNSFKFEPMKRFNPAAASATLAATSLPDGDIAIHAVTIERPTEPEAEPKRRKKTAPAATVGVITLTVNEERDLVELRFPGKPDDDVRAEMKAAKFRWYGPAGCWYHKHTPENLAWAKDFVARHSSASATPPEPTKIETTVPQAEPASAISAPVAPNPEADLRRIWNEQGVPKEKQDAILADTIAKAQPGAMVGPFQIPAAPAVPAWRQRFAR
jgi:hypothetical protein